MADNPTNYLADLGRIENAAEKAARERIRQEIERRMRRIGAWAMRQSKDEIAEELAILFQMFMRERQLSRWLRQHLEIEADKHHRASIEVRALEETQRVVGEQVQPIIDEWRKYRAARQLGPASKKSVKAKANIKQEWRDWQSGRAHFVSQAAFCRNMADKHDLKDVANIGKWCRKWAKETAKG